VAKRRAAPKPTGPPIEPDDQGVGNHREDKPVLANSTSLFRFFQRNYPTHRNGQSGCVWTFRTTYAKCCRSLEFFQEYIKTVSSNNLYVVSVFHGSLLWSLSRRADDALAFASLNSGVITQCPQSGHSGSSLWSRGVSLFDPSPYCRYKPKHKCIERLAHARRLPRRYAALMRSYRLSRAFVPFRDVVMLFLSFICLIHSNRGERFDHTPVFSPGGQRT
jgi:hypothetical protein